MMDQKVWTIGASSDCDIVVDHPAVSGQHCRLTRIGSDVMLIDLGSTNGTYVNGERLDSPRRVCSKDRITLGQTVALPWPQEAEPPIASKAISLAGERVIRIGRNADNDVVLDAPSVSGAHARVIVRGNQYEIEDLGSLNGTALNHPDQKIRRASFLRESTLYFGSIAVPASRFMDEGKRPQSSATATLLEARPIHPFHSMAAAPISLKGEAEHWRTKIPKPFAVPIAAASAVTVLILGLIFWHHERSQPTEVADSGTTASAPVIANPPIKPEPPSFPLEPLQNTATAPLRPPTLDNVEGFRECLYQVLIESPADSLVFRLGTAWVINERQLATSASVIRAAELQRANFPVVLIRPATGERETFLVTRLHVHPKFQKTVSESERLKKRLEALHAQLEDEKQDLTDEQVEHLVEELVETDEQLFVISERQACFDVGLLELEHPLPKGRFRPLRRSVSGTPPPQGATLKLVGLAFPNDDVLEPAAEMPPFRLLNSRCIGHPVEFADQPSSAGRILVRTDQPGNRDNWLGSPIVNHEGAVVATYVRPALPAEPGGTALPDRFDAAPIQRLNELLLNQP